MVGRVADIIRNADEVVMASSFLLADSHIERALTGTWGQQRCYVMLAAATRLRQDIGNEFDKMAHARHIKTLKNIAGNVLVRSSDDFHAKIVLADPGSDEPRGLFLTANLATEGLKRNQELFVELEPDEIREAASVLRWAFWEHSAHELAGDKLRDCKPLGKIKPAESKKILQTEPHRTIKRRIMEILDGRPKKITVASFGWDAKHEVVEKLCSLSRQGTSVTVLTRAERKPAHAAMVKMKRANIRILGFSWFHAKAVISDSHTLVMSANIEERGLERGFELGLTLEGKRAEEVKNTVSGWIDNCQYEFKAAVPAAPPAPAASGAEPERPAVPAAPLAPAASGAEPERPAVPAAPLAPAASGADEEGQERHDTNNLQIRRNSNRCNLLHNQGKHGKEPDMSNIRLVKVLTGEDGIGEGINDVDESQIAITKGRMIVADTTGQQLKVFDSNGVFVRSLACKTSEYGAPISPNMIALDSRNLIIVAGASTIHILDQSGVSIKEFDVNWTIKGIRTTSQGNIVVIKKDEDSYTRYENDRYDEILILDPSGKILDKISLTYYSHLYVGKNHVLEEGRDDIMLYDLTGRNTKEHAFKITKKDMTKQLGDNCLSASTFDDKGHMYIVVDNAILVFDSSGNEIKRITYGDIYGIKSIVALDHSRIAVSGRDGVSIWDGKEWHDFHGRGSILSASNEGVVISRDDYVYRLVPPDTVRTLLYKNRGIRIATDSMDRIIAADHGCVKILNPGGGIVETIVDADGRGERFGVIKAVAVDRQNRIVVRDDDHVRIFDANGKFVRSFTKREYSEKVDARLTNFLGSYPYLAYDSYGRAVVALKGEGIAIKDGDDTIKILDAPDADALTVDRWDRIIAAHGSSITIYDHNGSIVNSVWGRYIRADGVAADGMGRIIVSGRDSNDNGMIQVFAAFEEAPAEAEPEPAAPEPAFEEAPAEAEPAAWAASPAAPEPAFEEAEPEPTAEEPAAPEPAETESKAAKAPQSRRIIVGSESPMTYVHAVLTQLASQPIVTIKARGQKIARAVDVSQMIAKRMDAAGYYVKDVRIAVDSLISEDGEPRSVSTIEIDIARE